MNNGALLEYLRDVVPQLREQGEMSEETADALERIQAHVETVYNSYEAEEAPDGAETLRDLMLEALQLIYQGVEELLVFGEELDEEFLTTGLALVEEGHDVMNSIRHAVEQDQSWTSSAALG